ncbi:hypothetical protein K1W54_25735 [Micromonospora sp. CPCC 205371]|nr:hypothetical protein [Micromonospora sp. CPCC 205371]
MGVRWVASVAVAGLVALAGCGGSDAPQVAASPSPAGSTPATPATPTAAPSAAPTVSPSAPVGSAAGVTVERSGGFAGVMQVVVVEPSGAWKYQGDGGGSGPATGTFTPAQRAELGKLLSDPALRREGGGLDPRCADAFMYSLTTGSTRVIWTDCGDTSPPTATKIVELLADATPF